MITHVTDRMGGKKAMLIAALGSGLMNLIMGLMIYQLAGNVDSQLNIRVLFSFLYAANMYFQSFGAVAIVKVNASWFHVKERGGFSGIFGTMISSGEVLFKWRNAGDEMPFDAFGPGPGAHATGVRLQVFQEIVEDDGCARGVGRHITHDVTDLPGGAQVHVAMPLTGH